MIRGIYGLGPATFALLAMCGAFFFPINERVHRAILAGIRAHERGEAAVDPLTGELVPPPDDQELDEETGWFLDHFSAGELRRSLQGGRRTLLRDACLATTVSALICGGASASVVVSLGDFSKPPGLTALLGVLVSGIALTGVCFHAIRIRAALRARAVPTEDIRTHVENRRRTIA